MGMSTIVLGIKPPDEKWKKMKAVLEVCANAGIRPPKEVDDFFGGETPDDKGVIVSKSDLKDAVTPHNTDWCSGFDVDIRKLPKDVIIIRFYNSW